MTREPGRATTSLSISAAVMGADRQEPIPSRAEAFERYMALLDASLPCHRTWEQESEILHARDVWDIAKP